MLKPSGECWFKKTKQKKLLTHMSSFRLTRSFTFSGDGPNVSSIFSLCLPTVYSAQRIASDLRHGLYFSYVLKAFAMLWWDIPYITSSRWFQELCHYIPSIWRSISSALSSLGLLAHSPIPKGFFSQLI